MLGALADVPYVMRNRKKPAASLTHEVSWAARQEKYPACRDDENDTSGV